MEPTRNQSGVGYLALKMIAGIGLAVCATNVWALNIMLVNDDGCNVADINTLADTLESRGHAVTMYAPAGPQSGQGTRVTLPDGACGVRFDARQTDLADEPSQGDDRFCVAATAVSNGPKCGVEDHLPLPFTTLEQTLSASPADSAFVGLERMDPAPDLVISGINTVENVGTSTLYSGTLAAAVTAIRAGVPTLAVSRSVRAPSAAAAADFTADVVATLEANARNGRLLPAGVGLNINYPAGDPKGVLFTQVGSAATIGFTLVPDDDGGLQRVLDLDFTPQDIPAEDIEQEGIAQREGYVSISTIDGDYNAGRAARAFTRLKLHGVQAP